MKTVKLLCQQVYEWNKTDFWLINTLSILSGVIIYFYDVHPVFQALLIISLLVKVFTFMRASSVMPALGADTHQFSWKYMQSMPLNKKEIIAFFMITNLMSYLPLWIWFASFQPTLLDIFEYKSEGIFSLIKLHAFIFISMLIMTPMSLSNLIRFPRLQFSRKNEKAYFYAKWRDILSVVCGLTYLVCAVYYLDVAHDINVFVPFRNLYDFLELDKVTINWFSVFIVAEFLALIFLSKSVIKVWQKESLSYVKLNWSSKRDIPIMVGCLVLITLPFQFNFVGMKEYYRHDPLLKSAYLGDLNKVKEILKSDVNINFKNKYGATVLMAAAENGDPELFRSLEKLGASRSGKMKFKDGVERDVFDLAIKEKNILIVYHLLHNGYIPKKTALLDVASRCDTKLIDLVIEKGADVKAVNKDGESALHIATRSGCFGSVVSLVELGTDIDLKDKKGNTAKAYIKNYDGDLAYYLDKKYRSPAGKN